MAYLRDERGNPLGGGPDITVVARMRAVSFSGWSRSELRHDGV
jgi:hypothetical protein